MTVSVVRDSVSGLIFTEIKERAYVADVPDVVQPMAAELDVAFWILSPPLRAVPPVPPEAVFKRTAGEDAVVLALAFCTPKISNTISPFVLLLIVLVKAVALDGVVPVNCSCDSIGFPLTSTPDKIAAVINALDGFALKVAQILMAVVALSFR